MFKNHGTKIIGAVGTVVGTIAAFTPEQMTALFGSSGPGVALVLVGLSTVLRGFQNSGKIPGGPEKEVK